MPVAKPKPVPALRRVCPDADGRVRIPDDISEDASSGLGEGSLTVTGLLMRRGLPKAVFLSGMEPDFAGENFRGVWRQATEAKSSPEPEIWTSWRRPVLDRLAWLSLHRDMELRHVAFDHIASKGRVTLPPEGRSLYEPSENRCRQLVMLRTPDGLELWPEQGWEHEAPHIRLCYTYSRFLQEHPEWYFRPCGEPWRRSHDGQMEKIVRSQPTLGEDFFILFGAGRYFLTTSKAIARRILHGEHPVLRSVAPIFWPTRIDLPCAVKVERDGSSIHLTGRHGSPNVERFSKYVVSRLSFHRVSRKVYVLHDVNPSEMDFVREVGRDGPVLTIARVTTVPWGSDYYLLNFMWLRGLLRDETDSIRSNEPPLVGPDALHSEHEELSGLYWWWDHEEKLETQRRLAELAASEPPEWECGDNTE